MGRTNTHKTTTAAAPGLADDAPPPTAKPRRAPKASGARAAPPPSRPPPPKEKKAKKDKKEKEPAKRARKDDDDDDEEEEKKPAKKVKKAKKPVRALTLETETDSELENLQLSQEGIVGLLRRVRNLEEALLRSERERKEERAAQQKRNEFLKTLIMSVQGLVDSGLFALDGQVERLELKVFS